MKIAIVATTGAIAVVALLLGVWSTRPAVRKVAWGVAAVALLGAGLAWVLFDQFGVWPGIEG